MKISIIVPCYNVEKYIDRCIESIAKQTIGVENLEIILVNDASTDDTLNKMLAWEKKYSDNIMVITYDENIRQGGARNIGINYASSDYIGFVDSDDWIDPEMYMALYEKAIEGDYDAVYCKYRDDYMTDMTTMMPPEHQNDSEYVYMGDSKYSFYQYDKKGHNGRAGGVWSGIYKREIIIENKIYFPEKTAYEDNYWAGMMRLYTHKVYMIDRIYYHYFNNSESTLRKRNSNTHIERINVEKLLLDKYLEMGVFKDYFAEIMVGSFTKLYLNTFLIMFTRCDYVPADLYNSLRKDVYLYFPDWEKLWPIEDEIPVHQLLLLFLSQNENCTQEQMNELQRKYLLLYNNLEMKHSL